jgi:hypothetical protein
MNPKTEKCPLCRVAAALAGKGVIGDDDLMMMRRHVEQGHGLRRHGAQR